MLIKIYLALLNILANIKNGDTAIRGASGIVIAF